jgi:hypothetical protein
MLKIVVNILYMLYSAMSNDWRLIDEILLIIINSSIKKSSALTIK